MSRARARPFYFVSARRRSVAVTVTVDHDATVRQQCHCACCTRCRAIAAVGLRAPQTISSYLQAVLIVLASRCETVPSSHAVVVRLFFAGVHSVAAAGRLRVHRRPLGGGTESRQRHRVPGGAVRQHPPPGRRVRHRGADQQVTRLGVLGHTVRPSAHRRTEVRAARRRPAAHVGRRPQRVPTQARVHAEPAGPDASCPPHFQLHHAADGHENVRGLPLPERLQARR